MQNISGWVRQRQRPVVRPAAVSWAGWTLTRSRARTIYVDRYTYHDMYLVPGHFAMLLHCSSLFSLIHCCLRFHLARVWLSCSVMCQGGVIIVYCALTPLTTDNTHLIFSVGVKHNCSWPRSQARPPLHWQATSLLLLLFTVFLHDLIQSLCVLLFT